MHLCVKFFWDETINNISNYENIYNSRQVSL